MSQTTTAFAHDLEAMASGLSGIRSPGRMPPARPRWIPRYAIDTGTLVGAECIVGSRRRMAVVDAAGAIGAPVGSSIRADLDAAMGLVDELLLRGRPLPLSVPISSGDLADPELVARLRAWSLAHGGAHRLLELEIDIAGFHRRSAADWVGLATLGYEVTVCRATTVGPEARELGVSRLAFPQSLIRRAERDPSVAETMKAYVERARAQGLEPVIKGLAGDRRHRLLDLVSAGSWQPTTAVVSLNAEELYHHVCAHTQRRHHRRRTSNDTRAPWDAWDLTWTVSRAPAVDIDALSSRAERIDERGDVAATFDRLRVTRTVAEPPGIAASEPTSTEDVRAILDGLAEIREGEGAQASRRRRERECELVRWSSQATERRDDGAHNVRMGRISRIIAEALGLPEADCRMIEIAARMHDVGKIGIPDEILFKPGRLTPEERRVMETHAQLGWDILRGTDSPLIRLAAEIALSHHEKWDGTGYPHRLAGEAIPFVGRICALADVFDALMATRHYKEAWSLERAIAHIADNVGRHFDPRCAEAFFSRIDDIAAVVQGRGDPPGTDDRGGGPVEGGVEIVA